MAQTGPGSSVPFAMELPDRAPKQRYYDQGFFDLEAEQLWPRVWQMACRLEEIPDVGDFTEYTVLDQSVILIRTAPDEVRAFHNACRHRGVTLVEGPGHCDDHLQCPFHGWCYDTDGTNVRIPMRKSFSSHNLDADDVNLTTVRCELWGGCAWINLDDDAPPLRQSIEPAATILDAWKVESLRTEWWYACRLPVNWKLAQQAFQEMYHVVVTHPQLVIPGMRYGAPVDTDDERHFIDAEIRYLHTMSEGMAGMVHATDVAVAETLRDAELPEGREAAMTAWHRALNDAVVAYHRDRGCDVPDLNQLEDEGRNEPMGYCFPHYFVLPMYSSASSYRFRPLGPEETLMEIWSLTRQPEGETRPRPTPPEIWECDDERWPPIPAQDFSNLPRQQRGLHARGLDFLRLSSTMEGHISNYHRVIDGYLEGRPHEELLPALAHVNLNPLVQPIHELPLGGS